MSIETKGTDADGRGASRSAARSTADREHTEGAVELRTGGVFLIRAARPDDVPRLVAFHAALSPETLVRRYFGRIGALSAREAEQLTQTDDQDRVALVAALGPAYDAPIIALARCDRVAAFEAEVGLVVADAWQGRGVGTVLFARLVEHAHSRGITILHAMTQISNARVLGMARHAGYPCSARLDGLELELRLDIGPPAPPAR
jgi:GNAT superfamily N-acetyltransferase